MSALGGVAAVAVLTLMLTWASARRARGRAGYYTAGGRLGALGNGLAIAGDFVSAATLLGVTALYAASGLDALAYLLPFLLGLAVMALWMAGPIRRLGRFTLGDLLEARLPDANLRRWSGWATILISIVYLVAQMVGAGALVSLFGLDYRPAVMLVALLMGAYGLFGGMTTATAVQIAKTALLVVLILIMAVIACATRGGLPGLYQVIGARRPELLAFGGLQLSGWSALSLVAGITLGTAGLPHLLVRSFTVPDAATACRSVVVGAGIVGIILMLLFLVLAPAAVALVTIPAGETGLPEGATLTFLHLAGALGGSALFGIVAAVVSATILAVVAGLVVTIASAAANDVFEPAGDERAAVRRFRLVAVAASVIAAAGAMALEGQNVAVLVAIALMLSASANFPVLVLAIYWPGLTARGARAGGAAGLVSALVGIAGGPTVWRGLLAHPAPLFPTDYPVMVSVPLAFAAAWVVSASERRR